MKKFVYEVTAESVDEAIMKLENLDQSELSTDLEEGDEEYCGDITITCISNIKD